MSAISVTTRPDGVAVLTFDQPGSKANVLTRELWTEFGATLGTLPGDLTGLVLASAKPGIFIAGADLKLLANAPGPNDPEVRAFIEQGLRVLEQLEALPFPTCAAIDGAALGGGLEVALACDSRICGSNPKVQLGLPEVKLGLIPGWGGTQRLPRLIGIPESLAAIHSGEPISQTQLAPVVPSAGLLDAAAAAGSGWRARRQARKASLSPSERMPDGFYENVREALPRIDEEAMAARQAATDAIRGGDSLPLYEAIKLETEAFMRLAGSEESKRLIAQFFASRKK